jgi:predicted XRE-type DNA-binding protein
MGCKRHVSGRLYSEASRWGFRITCISEEIPSHIEIGHPYRSTTLHPIDEHAIMSKAKLAVKTKTARKTKLKAKVFANVWDAITDSPAGAANLRVRSELMVAISAVIKKNGWTQAQAAQHSGITQPRVNDLLRGRISRFSLDALVNIAASLGRRVHVALKAA